jgi:hypothetical protein
MGLVAGVALGLIAKLLRLYKGCPAFADQDAGALALGLLFSFPDAAFFLFLAASSLMLLAAVPAPKGMASHVARFLATLGASL